MKIYHKTSIWEFDEDCQKAYFLSFYRQAFLGIAQHDIIRNAPDLKGRERWVLFSLALWVLVFGFYPQAILIVLNTSSHVWAQGFAH